MNANADYLLVDWRAENQTVNNLDCPSPVTGLAGLALSRVQGTPSSGEFWGHLTDASCSDGGVTEILRARNLGSTGWIPFNRYTVRVVHSDNRLSLYVDGVLEIVYVGFASEGSVCFYGFNSEDVLFSNYLFLTSSPVELTPASITSIATPTPTPIEATPAPIAPAGPTGPLPNPNPGEGV